MEDQFLAPTTVFQPEYYEKFYCSAGNCSYNCCKGWEIGIDRAEYNKLRNIRQPSHIKKLLTKHVRRGGKQWRWDAYAGIYMLPEDRSCPLLNQQGLCALQIECGYKMLPTVCKQFPRIETNAVLYFVRGCSPACEEVVQLLLQEKNGIRFKQVPLELDHLVQRYNWTQLHNDFPAKAYYHEIRMLCISIMQNRAYRLDQRVILFGLAMRGLADIQTRSAWDEIPEWLHQKRAMAVGGGMEAALGQLSADLELSVSANVLLMRLMMNTEGSATKELTELLTLICDRIDAHLENEGAKRCSPETVNAYLQLRVVNKAEDRYEYLLENLLVNYFFYMDMPFEENKMNPWEQYRILCLVYSFLVFALNCMGPMQESELCRLIAMLSRPLMHRPVLYAYMAQIIEILNMDTMGHMAMLVKN